MDDAVGVDDGSGLEVVGRDALPLHGENSVGDVGEPTLGECEGDVEPRDAAREHLVRGLDVGCPVTVRHPAES